MHGLLFASVVLIGMVSQRSASAQDAQRPSPVAQTAQRVQELTLTAEPVRWEIQPGLVVDGWGYNGSIPGPTIRVTEGDVLRVRLVNQLPVPTTIHWHGVDVPVAMDGVPGLSQPAVEPGDEFIYEFTATNPGTRWYHSHVDSNIQIQLGLYGALIIDPKTPEPVAYDREFTYLLTEKALDVTPAVALGEADIRNRDAGNGRGGAFTPDLFLMNGRAASAIEPMTIPVGGRIRIRLINAGNQVHTMHLHGHSFTIIATDGNPVPPAARLLKDTVLIGPGERYDLEVLGTNPGVWLFHCHVNNHSANGMVTELRYDGTSPVVSDDAGHGTPAPLPSPASSSPPPTRSTPVASPAATAPIPPATSPTTSGESVRISMTDDRYTPSRLTIKAGATVTWVNDGNNLHTASALDGSFESGSLSRGEAFSYTFGRPGVYAIICRLHLFQNMRGTITVEP